MGAGQPASYVWTQQRTVPQRLRVLVVDDEPDTVASLLALLRAEGYEAEGAGSGSAALGIVESFDPDAVVIDLVMPELTGWDVAREIRKRKNHRRLMLIAVTGEYAGKQGEVISRAAGFNHFLVKPVDPSFLFNILAAIVRE